jgi:hypothetical protein
LGQTIAAKRRYEIGERRYFCVSLKDRAELAAVSKLDEKLEQYTRAERMDFSRQVAEAFARKSGRSRALPLKVTRDKVGFEPPAKLLRRMVAFRIVRGRPSNFSSRHRSYLRRREVPTARLRASALNRTPK